MSASRVFHLIFTLAACAVLGLGLSGCQDDPGFLEISPVLAGPYLGTMAPVDTSGSVRQDTIGTLAVIEATVNTNGSVVFQVTSIEGRFTATGGIDADSQLNATGTLNGETIVFTGTWVGNQGGHASGTWRNAQTGDMSFWSITQQGVASSTFVTAYVGEFTLGTIGGDLSFAIQADGSITGTAVGFGNSDVATLAGGINLNNLIVMTGSVNGEPVLFAGTLDTATRTVGLGTAATGLNSGIVGTWTAEVD